MKNITNNISYLKRVSLVLAILLPAIFICSGVSYASGIRVVPSVERATPGDSFSVDIIAENIPIEGMGAFQFRLNVSAPGASVVAVSDVSQAGSSNVSVASPLLVGPATATRSGLGDFFYNGRGSHGILVMDNETLTNGSGLYTFAHTNGSSPLSGTGPIARFQIKVGSAVEAEKILISLTDVMLLDSGVEYPLESNIGATVELRCYTRVPDLSGLSEQDALAAIQSSRLILGNIYEIDNQSKTHPLNKVLVQSLSAGSQVLCESSVDLAINTPPAEVNGAVAADKGGDESGAVNLTWIPSVSADASGYRVYLGSGSLLREIQNPSATGSEITGLPNGQASQLRITAFDSFGNESQGVIVSALPVDDVAPRISIAGVSEGAFYAGDVLPVIDIQEANLSVQEILLNGIAYLMAAIGIEGNYTLKVTAMDSSGNTSTREIHFVIDKTPPAISVAGIENNRYYSTDVTPVITISDANLDASAALLNNGAYVSGSAITTEGIYRLTISASDKAGNSSNAAYDFFIDKTMPVSSIVAGEPKVTRDESIFITRSTTFTITGIDEGIVSSGIAQLEYRINLGDWILYQSPFMMANLIDGAAAIDFRAKDRAGNTEDYRTVSVFLDNTSPETGITLGDPKHTDTAGALFASQATIFTLAAADALSGVAKTEYKIDEGEWTLYALFTITGEGNHTIAYRSADNLGNLEAEKTIAVVIDNTPPNTEISIGMPKYTSAAGNVYAGKETLFTLSSLDSSSGVSKMEYRIDNAEWTLYMPFTILQEGMHVIEYRSHDHVGNTEEIKSLAITIDNTPPVTEIFISDPKFTSADGTLYAGGSTTFTLSASDTLSGVGRIEYKIDMGEWTLYAPFTLPTEGLHTITYRSADNLGNTEIEKTLEVIIDNTPPVSTVTIGAPQYQSDSGLYISGSTLITMSSSDAGGGLKGIEYTIDDQAFEIYTGALNLESYADGRHVITYRATDNLGNRETDKTLEIILDKTPPETVISASDDLIPGIVNTVSPWTSFSFASLDNLSGVLKISYSIDGGEWRTYQSSFNLEGLDVGIHTIGFKAKDNVLNEESAQSITIRMISFDVNKGIALEPAALVGVWGYESDREDKEDKSDMKQKKNDMNALISILSSSGIAYFIPQSMDEFISALRSGRYNTYILVDLKDKFVSKEIREAVHFGDGLIFIKTKPDEDSFMDDLFGVKFKGKTTKDDLIVNLFESPISTEGTMQTLGRVIVSTPVSASARVFASVNDKKASYPAIVANEYGRGKLILFTFDLLSGTDQSQAAYLIANSLNYVTPEEHSLKALDSVPIRISVKNSTEEVDIKIMETLPLGVSVDTIEPQAVQTIDTITWTKSLAANERSKFGFYLNLPDSKGEYTTDSEISYSNSGSYRLYRNFSLTLSVRTSSFELLQEIMTELSSVTIQNESDAERISDAINHLNEINVSAASKKEAEKNLRAIIKAIDDIRRLSFDPTEYRLKLDELLKIWEKKWQLIEPLAPKDEDDE